MTRVILRFWAPLAATWFMMAAEGPFVAALVARLPEPKFNLAAFGIAMTLGFLAEAPIIMMLSASTALVRDRESLHRLRRFSAILNAGVTLLLLFVLLPPVFNALTLSLLSLPENVARITRLALWMLIPWPAAIGFRRFNHGILISSGRPRLVAYGTVVRLVTMALVGIILYATRSLDGAVVGTAALSMGVVAEAVASRFWAKTDIARLEKTPPAPNAQVPTYAEIRRFYLPLALTPLISMAAQPMVTFFVGRGRLPIESLAVIPVVNSFGFIFRCSMMAFQEVVITLGAKGAEALRSLRRFATGLGLTATCLMALIVLTPLSHVWFAGVSGLSEELIQLAIPAAMIQVLTPALAMVVSWMHARLVMNKTTRAVTIGTILEVMTIAATLTVGISFVPVPAVFISSFAILAGRAVASLYFVSRGRMLSLTLDTPTSGA